MESLLEWVNGLEWRVLTTSKSPIGMERITAAGD
jgi:hypothetical protein